MILTDKPLAAPGLTSYRFGWVMIGAKDRKDALEEARRSSDFVKPETLEVWDGEKYGCP